MITTTRKATKTLGFAFDIGNRYARNFHLKEQLNRSLNLRLAGALQHFKSDGVAFFSHKSCLFRHDGADENLHQAAFVEFFGRCTHANISLNCSKAPLVTSTFLNLSRATGSA